MVTRKIPRAIAHRLARQACAGQAMVFTLVFAAVLGIVVLLLFNSGMLANAKTRVQNAADAGAYSAALLQARDHNFSAYTNRAMVANQVAVAQFVSLKSYLEDATDTHQRMDDFLHSFQASFPDSKPLWDIASNAPIETSGSVITSIANGAVPALDLLIKAMETAQELHHSVTMLDMMLVADEVVKRNDPDSAVSTGAFQIGNTLIQINNWSKYTQRHAANDDSKEADRFADVVVDTDSLDSFIQNRASIPTAAWASGVSYCIGATSSFTFWGFVHGGGSFLSENKKRWLALDATYGGGAWTCTYGFPPFEITIGTPFTDLLGGSGGGLAGSGGGYGEVFGYKNNPFLSHFYGGGLFVFPPGPIRYGLKGPGSTLDSGGGLQDYYRDLADPTVNIPKDQSTQENGGQVPITIEVVRQGSTVRTSQKLLPDSNLLKLDDQFKDGSLKTLSSAHAYFYRPNRDDLSRFLKNGWQRDDNKTEVANLFNPYWQARLTERTFAEWLASSGLP
jgi:hypothetical protein